MHSIVLPIDTKSLYYNILNDNKSGHTCTVATSIKQGKTENPFLKEVYKIPEQIDFELHDALIKELTKNSKSVVKINNVFVFDNLMVNGQKIETEAKFCIYTKEEIDKDRIQFGRIKLHYPLSVKYEPLNIDNRAVINAISEILHGYAFIIEAFEYDFDRKTLNFKALVVGYYNIPYSKIFINNKGVGNKYNTAVKNYFDFYDTEIIALRKKYGEIVSTDNFIEYIEYGIKISKDIVKDYLGRKEAKEIRDISKDYPYSLFDFQFLVGKEIHYAIIFSTYTKSVYFNLTSWQTQFINSFNNVSVFLVTDIGGENNIKEFKKEDIKDMSVIVSSVRFIK